MLDLLTLVFPIFTLVAIGFFAAIFKISDETMSEGLANFVFIIATPALLFKMIVFNKMNEALPWGYISSYYIAMAITWCGVTFVCYKLIRETWGNSVIAGLSTGQANTVMIGIPLLISVYGDDAASPIAFLLAFNLPITMTLASVLLEGNKQVSRAKIAKNLLMSLLKHTILMSIFVALLWRYLNVPFPKMMLPVLDMLAATAIPASLVSLGMSLKNYGLLGKLKVVSVIFIAKLFVMPLLTFILAHFIFKLTPLWVGSAVIFGSMPAGVNAFLFAKRYGEGDDIAASAVALTTLASVFTIVLWLALLPK